MEYNIFLIYLHYMWLKHIYLLVYQKFIRIEREIDYMNDSSQFN